MKLKKLFKRGIAFFLSVVVAFSMFPETAMASSYFSEGYNISGLLKALMATPVNDPSISGPNQVMIGDTIQLEAVNFYYTGESGWSSWNTNVATVDNNGVVRGVSEGTATIYHYAHYNYNNDGEHVHDWYEEAQFTVTVTKNNTGMVKVAVYGTDGTSKGFNSDMQDLLKLPFVQDDGYAPAGVISLPESFFNGKSSPYIKSSNDLTTVLNAIQSIDKSYLVGGGASLNRDNVVASSLQYVQEDIKGTAGTFTTALFDWNQPEHNDAQHGSSIAGGTYKYHLDLRFKTNTLTFKSVNNSMVNDLGTRTYLTGTKTIVPGESSDWYLEIPGGYSIEGYYSDQNCRNTFTFGNPLNSDTTVYIKLVKEKLTISYDLAGGTSSSSQLTFNNVSSGDDTPLINDPVKVGYSLKGWKDSNGTFYEKGKLPQYATVSTTYTAQWEAFPYTVTVKANSDTLTYNGDDQTVSGYEVTNNPYGLTVSGLSASVTGKDVNTYTSEVTGTAVVKDKEGNDITAFTTVIREGGTLKINPKSVTVKSGSASKQYDGTPLTKNEVIAEGFADGEGLASYNATGTITNVGSVENTFVYALKDNTKASNYTIKEEKGTLTVTNRPDTAKYEITVKANGGDFTYDGDAHTVGGYTDTYTSPEGVTYTITGYTATRTEKDSGNYDVVITGTPKITAPDGTDVTDQFIVKPENGTLKIKKAQASISTANGSKYFDGKPLLMNTAADVTVSGFVKNEGVNVTVTGSQTYVGTSDNAFTYTAKNGTNLNNYEITEAPGKLTVSNRNAKYEITVEANSGSYKYDGKEHSVSGFKTLSFTVDGNVYTVEGLSAEAKGTNADAYTSIVSGTAVVKDSFENDVTAQFDVKTVDGKLTIDKRNITITSDSAEKDYDGLPLTKNSVEITGDEIAEGDELNITYSGTQTIPGYSNNTFTYTFADVEDVANYTITPKYGTLRVNELTEDKKFEITIVAKGNTSEYTYDGTVKSVDGIQSVTFPDNGIKYTYEGITAHVEGKDARTYYSYPDITKLVIKDEAGNDVTSQFKVNTTPGELVIAKRPVKLVSDSGSKKYDGDPLKVETAHTEGQGFAEGEGATYSFTGSQRLVGSSENYFTYTLNENTNADNYVITTANGTLTVTARDTLYTITVEANGNDGTILYDGDPHTVSGLKQTEYEIEGHKYIVTGLEASATGTDADEYPVNVTGTAVVKDEAGNDVTSQFAVETKPGKLVITKRTVTLESATDTKQYDGTALTNDMVTVGGDGFVKNEGMTFTVTGSQTLVGESGNFFSFAFNEGTKAENYIVSKKEGTLKVIDRDAKYEITVIANSGEFTYDGTQKNVSGFVNQNLEYEFNGKKYTVSGLSASASRTDAGESTVVVSGSTLVSDENGQNVTSQFNVKKEDGKLTVMPRTIKLTSATESKEFDGSELKNTNVTVSGDGFANGEGARYIFDSSATITYPGTVTNKFTYELNDNTNPNNYSISVDFGSLTILDRGIDTKYKITLEPKNATWIYNGSKQILDGFKTLTFTVGSKEYTVHGMTAYAEGTDADKYLMQVNGTPVVKDSNGNDVTAQFMVDVAPNQYLVITPRSISMTSDSANKVYDGKPLTKEGVTVTGDGFVEGEGATYTYSGSQLLVGTSANTFDYVLTGNAKAVNYSITKNYGTLNVTNRGDDEHPLIDIEVKTKSGEEIYDGTEKILEGFEETTFEIDGETYTVSGIDAVAKGTDPGEYQGTVEGKVVVTDSEGNDVTDQFNVIITPGTLKIKATYSLTINYVDVNKNELRPPYKDILVEGTVYGPIVSPVVEGYTPDYSSISSDEKGIWEDQIVYVYYRQNPTPTPDEPDPTPDPTPTPTPTPDPTPTPTPTPNPTPTPTPTPTPVPGVPPTEVPGVVPTPGPAPAPTGITPTTPKITEVVPENSPAGVVKIDEYGNAEVISIEDEETALAGTMGAWALLNLILAVITLLVILFTLLKTLLSKKKDEEEDEDVYETEEEVPDDELPEEEEEDEDEEEKKEKRRKRISRITGIIVSIASIVIFFLTEDMRLPMRFVDKWSILMALLTILEILLAYLALKKKKEEDEEEEEEEPAEEA